MAEEREREVKNAAKDLVKTQRRAARWICFRGPNFGIFILDFSRLIPFTFFCREAKRKAKTLHKMGLTEEEEMSERIGTEERKLLLDQRKLESIRILDELVERVKVMNSGPQQSS